MKAIDHVRSKIVRPVQLAGIRVTEREAGKKIVFTNGCFDILHRGHVEYLASAADLGEVFIIGLNNDDSVRRIKGKDRPAVDEESRALSLAGFEFVDYVVLFSEDTPVELIKTLSPDIWVKGGDYKNIHELPEYRVTVENGGEVIVLPFVEGFSTSDIYNKIQGSAKK